VELYFHSPNAPSRRGAQLEKHRDNFTFTFTHKVTAWRSGKSKITVRVIGHIGDSEGG
jgi:hypothetical protein